MLVSNFKRNLHLLLLLLMQKHKILQEKKQITNNVLLTAIFFWPKNVIRPKKKLGKGEMVTTC